MPNEAEVRSDDWPIDEFIKKAIREEVEKCINDQGILNPVLKAAVETEVERRIAQRGAPSNDTTREVERYERLQRAAETQIQNVWNAYDKHASLIKWAVVVIVAVGGFFFYKNVTEFKESIQSRLDTQLGDATNHLNATFLTISNNIEFKVAYTSNRIDQVVSEGFKRENVEKLIESGTRGKIAQVTDKIIVDQIESNIEPKLLKITNQLAAMSLQVNDLTNVIAVTEFALVAAKAENQDYSSFSKLQKYAQQKETAFPDPYTVRQIIGAITAKSEFDAALKQSAMFYVEWDNFGVDPKNLTLNDYKRFYHQTFNVTPEMRFSLIKLMFNDTKLSEVDRFDFLAEVLQYDNDILVLQEACNLMDGKRKSHQNFGLKDEYLKWYNENRGHFQKTP